MTRQLSLLRLCSLVVALALLAAPAARAGLSAPQYLEVTSTTDVIELNWDVVDDPGVGGYLVSYDVDGPDAPYQGTGAAEGSSPIQVAGAQNHVLTLHGLLPETRYYFVVNAYDLYNNPGDPSRPGMGVLCDILPPAAPVGLTGTIQIDGVHLSWTPNTEVDAYGTTVYRGLTPTPTDSIGFVLLPDATFFEPPPGYNQTWYYRLKAMDFCGIQSGYSDVIAVVVPPQFSRSDVDASGEVNISDPIYNLDWLFNGGPPPPCLEAADDDDTGFIDVNDPIYSLEYQFNNGPAPAYPFPGCGMDVLTPDSLGCLAFAPCGTGPDGPAPVPSDGSEVMALEPASSDGETVTYNVLLRSGTPLVGLEGTLLYPSGRMTFVGLERTGYTQSWAYLSAKADPEQGKIHLGGIPDYHLQNPILPQGDVAAVLTFRLQEGSAELHAQEGRFVAPHGSVILPQLEDPTSSVPGRAARAVPTLAAPNPYRAGAAIRMAGGEIGQQAEVSLFNVKGERVRILFQGALDRPEKVLAWDGCRDGGANAGPGLYYVRARLGETTLTRKLLYLP